MYEAQIKKFKVLVLVLKVLVLVLKVLVLVLMVLVLVLKVLVLVLKVLVLILKVLVLVSSEYLGFPPFRIFPLMRPTHPRVNNIFIRRTSERRDEIFEKKKCCFGYRE
jgi:hypothetical protein